MVLSYGQRGTLTNQLKDGRWEAQVGLIKMTLEEKEFDLVQAQQERPSQEKTSQCRETCIWSWPTSQTGSSWQTVRRGHE
ncbi:Recombination inhibitory protein MutS2 [Streptococcus oralis]|nr:Recombination inhibitory protein MutS2 [Streptococcus oralis]